MQKQVEKALTVYIYWIHAHQFRVQGKTWEDHYDIYTYNVEVQDLESSTCKVGIEAKNQGPEMTKSHSDLTLHEDVNLPKHLVKEDTIIEVKNCMPAVPPGK